MCLLATAGRHFLPCNKNHGNRIVSMNQKDSIRFLLENAIIHTQNILKCDNSAMIHRDSFLFLFELKVGTIVIRIRRGEGILRYSRVKTGWVNLLLPSRLEDGRLRKDPVLTSSHEKAKNVSCPIGEFFAQNLPNWQVLGGFESMRKREGVEGVF